MSYNTRTSRRWQHHLENSFLSFSFFLFHFPLLSKHYGNIGPIFSASGEAELRPWEHWSCHPTNLVEDAGRGSKPDIKSWGTMVELGHQLLRRIEDVETAAFRRYLIKRTPIPEWSDGPPTRRTEPLELGSVWHPDWRFPSVVTSHNLCYFGTKITRN